MSLLQKVFKNDSESEIPKLNQVINVPPSKLPLSLDPLILPALKFITGKETITENELREELNFSYSNERPEKIINDLISIGVIKNMDKSKHQVLLKDLSSFLKENFILKELIEKADKARKDEEKIITNEYKLIIKQYKNYIEKFCELAYREVKALDEWGDENSEALMKLKAECIRRIAKNLYKEAFEKNEYAAEKWLTDLYEYSYTYEGDKLKTVSSDAPLWVKNLFLKDLPLAFDEYCKKKNNIPLSKTQELNDLSGKEFEIYIANLLKKAEFNVSGTPETGDQGADLIAIKNDKTYVMQLKRNLSNVGNKAIQEAVAAKSYYDGDIAVVVTNSLFTQSAKKLARKNNVLLIDKKGLPNILGFLE